MLGGKIILNKKNIGKIVGVLFFLLIFIFGSVSTGLNNSFKKQPVALLSGDTLYVGGSGLDNYTSIQDAIDNASDGDIVFVFGDASPYHENVVIDKSIFLIGEDKNIVVIDAGLYGAAVTIIADDVFVSGFKMITFHDNPNNFDSELVDILSVNNVTIRDNIIQQNQIEFGSDRGGVILRNSSYCFIQNNSIIKVDDPRPCWGVVLMDGSTFINVSGNEIYNYSGGILIWSSSDSVIYMNYLHHNCFGINSIFGNNNHIISNIINFNWNGIKFDVSCNNVVSGNIITDNGEGDDVTLYYGIGLFISSDNYFSYNHISNNDPVGIYILSDRNNIRLNHISSNIIGVYCDHGSNNFISDNNFVLNEKNGYFEGVIYRIRRNIWKGNYWDEPRFRPYPIYGQGYFLFFSFKWFNFDWHPTQEPYDI